MPTPEISVQLYSIHAALDADLDGSLGKIADIGLRTVEAFDFVRRADELKASFDKYGLSAPTAHAILIEDEGVATPDGLLTVPPAEETFAAANLLGVQDRHRPVRRAGPLGHPGRRAAQRRPAERPRRAGQPSTG